MNKIVHRSTTGFKPALEMPKFMSLWTLCMGSNIGQTEML